MPEIIATGGGTDEDLKQNPFRALWEKFSSLDRFSKTLVITTVLFLVFASAITTMTLQTRSNAAQTIGKPPSPKGYLTKTPTPTKKVTNTPSPTKYLTKTPTSTPTKTKTPTPTPPLGSFYLKTGVIKNLGGGKIGVTLSWSQVSGAVKYNVYQRNSTSQNYGAAFLSTGGLTTEADVNGTLNNYFMVQACSTTNCTYSNEVYVSSQVTPTNYITPTSIYPTRTPTPTPH